MPAQLFDRIPWLTPAKQGVMAVAIEVRAAGHVRIVPIQRVDKLLGAHMDTEMTGAILRRTFVGRIGESRRLSLPDILAGTVFAEWPKDSHAVKVLIECHASHFELMTPDAWLAIVKDDPDIETLAAQSEPEG